MHRGTWPRSSRGGKEFWGTLTDVVATSKIQLLWTDVRGTSKDFGKSLPNSSRRQLKMLPGRQQPLAGKVWNWKGAPASK